MHARNISSLYAMRGARRCECAPEAGEVYDSLGSVSWERAYFPVRRPPRVPCAALPPRRRLSGVLDMASTRPPEQRARAVRAINFAATWSRTKFLITYLVSPDSPASCATCCPSSAHFNTDARGHDAGFGFAAGRARERRRARGG